MYASKATYTALYILGQISYAHQLLKLILQIRYMRIATVERVFDRIITFAFILQLNSIRDYSIAYFANCKNFTFLLLV